MAARPITVQRRAWALAQATKTVLARRQIAVTHGVRAEAPAASAAGTAERGASEAGAATVATKPGSRFGALSVPRPLKRR